MLKEIKFALQLTSILRRSKMQNWLSGKKTYVVCLVALVTAIGAYASGDMSLGDLIQAIFVAIGGMTMRSGISKK